MKIFSSKKRVAAIGVVTAATLVGGGMAVAYWTTTGSGEGTATTGTSSKFVVEIDPTDNPPVDLAPGNGTQNFSVTVTNPGTAGVQNLSDVVVTVAGRNAGTGASVPWAPGVACSAADYSVSAVTPAFGVDGVNLDPGEPWTGTFTVEMVNNPTDSQDACKDLDVPLYAAAS